jgi:hypothetical protein
MIKTAIRHAKGSNAGKLHLSTSADMNVALCMVPDIKIALQCLTKNTYCRAPVSTDSVFAVYRGPKKKFKIKEIIVS